MYELVSEVISIIVYVFLFSSCLEFDTPVQSDYSDSLRSLTQFFILKNLSIFCLLKYFHNTIGIPLPSHIFCVNSNPTNRGR